MKPWIAVALFVAIPLASLANVVISPEEKKLLEEASDRAATGDYDVADPYCAGKSIGKPCRRSGSPFEGGGAGICRTSHSIIYDKDGRRAEIRATCVVEKRYRLDSGVSPSEYRWKLPKEICAADPSAKIENAGCAEGAVSDKFCRDKKAGEACLVELTAEGETQPEAFPGICRQEPVNGVVNANGRLIPTTADYLACRTPNLEEPALQKSSPPGFWGKIFE
jgi:hypothetical protein